MFEANWSFCRMTGTDEGADASPSAAVRFRRLAKAREGGGFGPAGVGYPASVVHAAPCDPGIDNESDQVP